MNQSKHPASTEREKQDTHLTLGDCTQDIRNRNVVDPRGEEIGHIIALFIDQEERKVQILEVRAGTFLGLGDRHFLIPVSAITSITKAEVHVNQTRERIVGSPIYDPALIVATTREYWEPYYGYYGMLPYWRSEFMYPCFPKSRKYPDTNKRSRDQREPSEA